MSPADPTLLKFTTGGAPMPTSAPSHDVVSVRIREGSEEAELGLLDEIVYVDPDFRRTINTVRVP